KAETSPAPRPPPGKQNNRARGRLRRDPRGISQKQRTEKSPARLPIFRAAAGGARRPQAAAGSSDNAHAPQAWLVTGAPAPSRKRGNGRTKEEPRLRAPPSAAAPAAAAPARQPPAIPHRRTPPRPARRKFRMPSRSRQRTGKPPESSAPRDSAPAPARA